MESMDNRAITDGLDSGDRPNMLMELKVYKYWFLKLVKLLSEHYVVVTSILATVFSVLCYFHAEAVFEHFGLNFLHFANISDIYVIALSTGVIAATLLKAIFLALFIFVIFTTPTIKKRLQEQGFMTKVIKLMFITIIIMFTGVIYLMSVRSYEAKMTRSMESHANEQLPRYRVLTTDDPKGRGCIAILTAVANNIVTWNYEANQVEVIPKSRIIRTDFILRAPLRYIPNLIRKGQSSSGRMQELEWVKKNHLEWGELLKSKCNEDFKINSKLDDEMARLRSYLEQ